MLINEIARLSGLSTSAIRYYEHEGLLDARHVKRSSNGYRHYNQVALARLQRLKQARSAGFSMKELHCFAQAYDEGSLTNEMKKLFLEDKIHKISKQIVRLSEMKAGLEAELRA